jgi:hypothetical protein
VREKQGNDGAAAVLVSSGWMSEINETGSLTIIKAEKTANRSRKNESVRNHSRRDRLLTRGQRLFILAVFRQPPPQCGRLFRRSRTLRRWLTRSLAGTPDPVGDRISTELCDFQATVSFSGDPGSMV